MRFPKPYSAIDRFTFEPLKLGLYSQEEVDAWREALSKELTSIVEKHKGEPLAEPTIILLEKLLDEWLK